MFERFTKLFSFPRNRLDFTKYRNGYKNRWINDIKDYSP